MLLLVAVPVRTREEPATGLRESDPLVHSPREPDGAPCDLLLVPLPLQPCACGRLNLTRGKACSWERRTLRETRQRLQRN